MDVRTVKLDRRQLGAFLSSPETIKAFENLALNSDEFGQVITAIQQAPLLTLAAVEMFDNERVLGTDGEVQATDGGPGGSYTLGLSDTGVDPGSYGSEASSVRVAINAKGRITLAQEFPLVTDNVAEGAVNLYFTTARARVSINSGAGLAYDPSTGTMEAGTVLAAYAGGDTPSAFTLGIVDSADAAAWRTAIGMGSASTQNYTSGTYTPAITSGAGSFTSVSADGEWTRIGDLVTVSVDILITTNGTASDKVYFSLPFTNAQRKIGCGREVNTLGKQLQIEAQAGQNVAFMVNYDNTYPGADGYRLCGTLTYRV